LGHELVTLLALVGRQLVPHRMVGASHGILRRWEQRKILVHHALLLVVVHKA
jgi:hypothetical protein